MTATGTSTGTGSDDERWRESGRLRSDHPGWVIVWLIAIGEFHAYHRLPGARRDTVLSAATAAQMADLIGRAEQTAAARPVRRGRGTP